MQSMNHVNKILEEPTLRINADLIDRAIRNDREAHYQLYKKHNRAMYNTALRITK